METWTCKSLLALIVLFVLIPFAFGHEISVPANVYFGIPAYGTYISFEDQMTFGEVYRENDFWYFDGFGFSVQNANLTISKFFADDQLVFIVTTSYDATAVARVTLPGSTGKPSSVLGASSWYYDSATNGLTVTLQGPISAIVVIDWTSQPGIPNVGVEVPDFSMAATLVVKVLIALAVMVLVLVFLVFPSLPNA